MLYLVRAIRHLFITACCCACASTGHLFSDNLTQAPETVSDRVVRELRRMDYQAEVLADSAAIQLPGSIVKVYEIRGERAAGRDFEARGILYDVLLVTVTRSANGTDSEISVRAGMESVSFMGLRRRVPSRPQVREDAQALLNRLRQNPE